MNFLTRSRCMKLKELCSYRSLCSAVSDTSAQTTGRMKHRVPKKRASKLHLQLKLEAFEKLKNGRQWPEIKAGDAVEIKRLDYMTATEADTIRGVVIAVTSRFSDSAISILNYEYGTPFFRRIVLYNPLVQDVKILQRAFIHDGKKRVRRSKLYYLQDRDPKHYTVKY
mmetsp:Transcript_23016/g.33673  ORF Transcript_23016/g.33673 Transcript_23016/m.33673 type:complete len:168 (+) Transcript_23016:97-600(+)